MRKHSGSDASIADILEQARLEFDALEERDDWKINNLEYDLRSNDWILNKARGSEVYSQNLYAALCNNEFCKIALENTPENIDLVLAEGYPTWSCSWRHAGGIISDMRGEGDYIDWYCSGITNHDYDKSPNDASEYTEEQLQRIETVKRFVAESIVTDEIRDDLNKLGWKVLDSD